MKTTIIIKRSVLSVFFLFCIINTHAVLQERVYVQTDKQLYIAGELVWLKFYTTDLAGKLLSLSKVGYVELVNDSIPEVQIRLDVTAGTGNGWMELPAMLPTGNYRLVAYTRYMKNEDENVFFEKMIAIVNPFLTPDNSINKQAGVKASPIQNEWVKNTISISTDRISYAKRDKGEIRLQGLPDDCISMAVSVAGIDTFTQTTANIRTWQQILQNKPHTSFNGNWQPEYEGAIFNGQLIDLGTNQPASVPGVISLLSFPGKNIQLYNGQTNTNGNVTFYTNRTNGKKEVAVTAISTTDKKYRIDLQPPFATHAVKPLPALQIDTTWQHYLLQRSLGVQVIQAYTADSLNRTDVAEPYFMPKPYKSYALDEYTRFPFLEEIFTEFIPIARINKAGGKRSISVLTEQMNTFTKGNTLVLFDNIPIINQEEVCNYNPLLLKKIDVYLGHYIFGGQLFDGIISFSTYKGDFQGITLDAATQLYDQEGTEATRYFYAPSYENSASIRIPDFRHTLLWVPSLQSNKQKGITLPFTTSDLPGKYLITVEGIGKNGTVVHATQIIGVEN